MDESFSRRSRVEPFYAMDVLAEANRLKTIGRPVLTLAVGQPGDAAPPSVVSAARAALVDGRLGYTDALGIRPLREAISKHYLEHYSVDIEVERVVVTTGSSAGFNLAFLSLFDAGDCVAITVPGYPAYRNILKVLGIKVVEIPLSKEPFLTAETLEKVHAETALKGVLFASPANPTGTIMPKEALSAVLEKSRELGILAISDEIYHRLNYVGPDVTALEYDEEAVVINSFSKYYCMTGWRVGWMIVPKSLVRPIERIQQSLYISAPELSQQAAIAAFDDGGYLDTVKARYIENRALLSEKLPQIGFSLASPMDGAFYAYCDVSSFTNDSMIFAKKMLSETNVAATPGVDFDPMNGRRTIRFSYAGQPDDIAEAIDRLERWMRG